MVDQRGVLSWAQPPAGVQIDDSGRWRALSGARPSRAAGQPVGPAVHGPLRAGLRKVRGTARSPERRSRLNVVVSSPLLRSSLSMLRRGFGP
jgi:hypothetical protein